MLCALDLAITVPRRPPWAAGNIQDRLAERVWMAARSAAACLMIALLAQGPLIQAQRAARSGALTAGTNQNGSAVTPGVTVCATGPTVEGVDVYSGSGTINWSQVSASGRIFAYARATDGTTFTDPTFVTNYAGIKAAGMLRGAYHFFEPAVDPTAQANFFLSKIPPLGPGDLSPELDVEITGGQPAATIAANIQTWVNAVKAATGRTPVIYTAAGFWDASVASSAFGSDYLWVANYGVTCPTLPTGWSNWVFWQYSGSGTVNGIPGTVDLDRFNNQLSGLTSVTLTSSAASALFRRYVTFTATVNAPGIPASTSTITFMDGGKAIQPAFFLPTGQVVLRTNQFAAGQHSFTAFFSGDTTYHSATSTPVPFYRPLKPH